MDRPFRKGVSLTAGERWKFQQLVNELHADGGPWVGAVRLGWLGRLRMSFWRHRRAATLLVPIGLAVMMTAVLTWWPMGVFGSGLLGLGLVAAAELVRGRYRRRNLPRSGTGEADGDGDG